MLKPKLEIFYTYADYLSWPDEERWEIIEGVPYSMSPAPNPYHQEILGELTWQFENFLRNKKDKKCKVYFSPIDVILSEKKSTDDEIFTVVQPDIIITCDLKKIDKRGHQGSPDFIVEVVSPFNASNDYIKKLNLYEKYGVKEYWIVDPRNLVVQVYILGKNGKYKRPNAFSIDDKVKLHILKDLEVDFSTVFKEIED